MKLFTTELNYPALDSGSFEDATMSEFLFDAALLCNWEDTLAERIESSDLKLRPLMRNDYDKGYLELLGQLTTVGTVDKTTFERK